MLFGGKKGTDVSMVEVFDDSFIDHLFETIEDTRCSADETLNYYLIKLIVSLFLYPSGLH